VVLLLSNHLLVIPAKAGSGNPQWKTACIRNEDLTRRPPNEAKMKINSHKIMGNVDLSARGKNVC
jgi:hypothetical protein